MGDDAGPFLWPSCQPAGPAPGDGQFLEDSACSQTAGSISRQAGGLFFTLSRLFQSERAHSQRAGRTRLAGGGLLVAADGGVEGCAGDTSSHRLEPFPTEARAGGGSGDARAGLWLPLFHSCSPGMWGAGCGAWTCPWVRVCCRQHQLLLAGRRVGPQAIVASLWAWGGGEGSPARVTSYLPFRLTVEPVPTQV